MNKTFASGVSALALAVATTLPAHAATATYNVTTVWYEPDTQPKDSIFIGTFDYDGTTHAVTNLQGRLSEAMTGDTMTWLSLGNQLATWHDDTLGGTFAATFLKTTTKTFTQVTEDADGNITVASGWTPEFGVQAGGTYAGYPNAYTNTAKSTQNAYALIFVPDAPTAALTPAQLAKLAYADCAPGGMMGATCMTGTSVAGYGAVGTMGGVPFSQTITAVSSVPEPSSFVLGLMGLGVAGMAARRRQGR
ncbi:MAG: hypothetical protein RI907_3731 [Pseudomonadota bacterium]|jgi:hypothetical protein